MKIGYVSAVNSEVDFQEIILLMSKVGVDPNNIVINPNFSEFINTLRGGDVIVIKNLNMFSSVSELFSQTIALLMQNITIYSIDEPWFTVTESQIEFLQGSRLPNPYLLPLFREGECQVITENNLQLIVKCV